MGVLTAALLLAAATAPVVALPHADVVVVGHVERPPGGAVALSWAASELRARFTGTSLLLDVEERAVDVDGQGADWLVVTLDGKRTDVAVPPGRGRLPVATGLPPGEHEVSILKRTEPLVGTVVVHALVLDEGARLLPAPPPRARRIEVIGDSGTTGFGVTGDGPRCPFTAATQDVTMGFAGLVARRFSADLVTVAWSGRGVVRDFEGKAEKPQVPALYRAAPALDGRAPDVVVIALGGNDFLPGVPERGQYIAAMHALLDGVRARHPRAWIVLASPMPLTPSPDDPVATVATGWTRAIFTKRGDGRMSWTALPHRDDRLGLGCVWHAGPRMHERLAGVVGDEIAKRLGW